MENLNILTEEQTIKYLIKNKCSISRFGDGEFRLIRGFGIHFQEYNYELSQKLKEILKNGTNKNCIVAIPPIFNYPNNYKKKIYNYWNNNIRGSKSYKNALIYMNNETFYGSSFLSRIDTFNIDLKKKYIELITKLFNEFSKITYIVNQNIKNKIIKNNINDFVNFIIIPPTNAYESYNTIVNKMNDIGNKCLYIICAGPTATIISYELSEKYTILDLGHFFDLLINM